MNERFLTIPTFLALLERLELISWDTYLIARLQGYHHLAEKTAP